MKQTTISKWFITKRVEKKAEITNCAELVTEGLVTRTNSSIVNADHKLSFTKAKKNWEGLRIASYNVETLGNNRIQTICREMEEKL